MSLRQKAIRGVLWSAVQSWGTSLIGMLTFLVLARILEPQAFGLLALGYACIALLEVLLRGGFSQALIQRSTLEPAHLDTAFWLNLLLGAALAAAALATAGLAARAFGEPQLAAVIRWLSLTLLIGPLATVQQALLRRRLAFRYLAVRALLASAIGGIVGIGMAVSGWEVWSLVGQSLVSTLASAVILWTACDWRPGRSVSRRHFNDLFGFGAYVVGANVLHFVRRRSDALAIGFFLGPVQLGYYAVGQRFHRLMLQLLTNSIGSVGFPTFSRLQHDLGQMRAAFYTVTRITFLVSCPAFLGMAVLAPELVHVLFGPRWAASVPVVQALAFMGILQTVSFFASAVLRAAGKPAWLLQLLGLQSTAIALLILLTVRWGIVAVAVACVAAEYLFAPLRLWAVHKLIGIDFRTYLHNLRDPFFSTLLMLVTVWGTKQLTAGLARPGVLLAIYLLVGAIAYLLVSVIIAPALIKEVGEMLGTARPARRRRPK